jgi:hypothetical protein
VKILLFLLLFWGKEKFANFFFLKEEIKEQHPGSKR